MLSGEFEEYVRDVATPSKEMEQTQEGQSPYYEGYA